jgi:hypothetical protein
VPHLLHPRIGWENENLAAYLLSRFCFIARPNSVGDDVGTDFFCTIFEIGEVSGRDALMPRKSFAIQVKSSDSEVEADNKIGYLSNLDLPYFIGVLSQSRAAMDVYSAEMLPVLFSEVGLPNRLSLLPVEASAHAHNDYFDRLGEGAVRLRCPRLFELRVAEDRASLNSKVKIMLSTCTRVLGNIAARVSEEHIYEVDSERNVRILAGPGSVQFFRQNFIKRLAEVFYNFLWILNSDPENFPIQEFRIYESIYQQIESLYDPFPFHIFSPYQTLRARVSVKSAPGVA